jgi:hypothetical protein
MVNPPRSAAADERFVGNLFEGPGATVAARPSSSTTREDYIDRVVVGGFPMALAWSTPCTQHPHDGHVAEKRSARRRLFVLYSPALLTAAGATRDLSPEEACEALRSVTTQGGA